jgi:hypothetical protein
LKHEKTGPAPRFPRKYRLHQESGVPQGCRETKNLPKLSADVDRCQPALMAVVQFTRWAALAGRRFNGNNAESIQTMLTYTYDSCEALGDKRHAILHVRIRKQQGRPIGDLLQNPWDGAAAGSSRPNQPNKGQ